MIRVRSGFVRVSVRSSFCKIKVRDRVLRVRVATTLLHLVGVAPHVGVISARARVSCDS